MTAAPTAFEAQIKGIHAEAAGLLSIEIVRKCDAPDLMLAALLGDAPSRRLTKMVLDSLAKIESAPRNRPLLCAVCPRPIRAKSDFSLVLGTPVCDSPTQGLAMAICARCATSPDDLLSKARLAFSKIWPDLRPINIHPAEGNA